MAGEGVTIQLVGAGYSGRGVRVRMVGWKQQMAIEKSAAATITPESKQIEYTAEIQRYGTYAMIVSITEPCTPGEHVAGPWKPMTAAILEESWDDFFTPKDTSAIRQMHDRMHGVTAAEVDAIMGKAIPFVD